MEKPASTARAQLTALGLTPKRSFGQNFLVDARMAERIAVCALPEAGGTVVEIGAGLGALTEPLVLRASVVHAIERDRDLIAPLEARFSRALDEGRLHVVEADAKSVDFEACFQGAPEPHVIAGNLPYQITGPLLRRVVGLRSLIRCAALLVQLEVADRIRAAPQSPSYGALSVFVQAQFAVDRPLVVKRGLFYPVPKVDSALVVLTPLKAAISEETSLFRALVRGAFEQRRKQLHNAWRGVADSERLSAAAERVGVDLRRRGESLSVPEFAAMARALEESR